MIRTLLVTACALGPPAVGNATAQSEIDIWASILKPEYFGNRKIIEGKSIVKIRLPRRAEDAGVVPVSINSKIPQTPERHIEELYICRRQET